MGVKYIETNLNSLPLYKIDYIWGKKGDRIGCYYKPNFEIVTEQEEKEMNTKLERIKRMEKELEELKAQIKEEEKPKFEPFTLELEIKTEDELKLLWECLNVSYYDYNKSKHKYKTNNIYKDQLWYQVDCAMTERKFRYDQ